jgi:hypothetical protein
MKMETHPLYGILVTQKSYMLSRRALALQHHARYLAFKVARALLPVELCDQIGIEIYTLQVEDALRLWKKMKGEPEARLRKFQYGDGTGTGLGTLLNSELVGQALFACLSVRGVADGTIHIKASEACIDLLSAVPGKFQRYIHLSASLTRPSVSMLIPGVAACSGGGAVSLANNKLIVANQPDSATQQSSETVYLGWDSTTTVARLVQMDDVEASIRSWNQEFIEKFVKQLELDAVIVRGEDGSRDGLKPQLRLLQRFTLA